MNKVAPKVYRALKKIYLLSIPEEILAPLLKTFDQLGIEATVVRDERELKGRKIEEDPRALILCPKDVASSLLNKAFPPIVAILSPDDPHPLPMMKKGLKAYLRYPCSFHDLRDLLAQLMGLPPL